MRVRWTARATRALLDIRDHIAEDNPTAARALVIRTRDYARATLSAHPFMGRPGRVEGTRESVVHPSYILVYRIERDTLEILTIRHVARNWPTDF